MLRTVSVWTGKPGSPWYSTLYYEGSLSTDAQAAVDATDELMSDLLSLMVGQITVETEPFVASVSAASGLTTGGFVVEPREPETSGGSSTMVPAASQALAQLRTGAYIGGREIRGKFYVPGLATGFTDVNGRLVDAAQTALQGHFDEWLAGPSTPQVYSRKNSQAVTIDSVSISRDLAVLRSRRD